MKTLLIILAKFAFAGAIIAGIGLLTLTQDPEQEVGEVKEAEADLVWSDDSDAGRWSRAMEAAGIAPRAYDLNGNVMYFGTTTSDKPPGELLDAFQQHFVEYGVNDKKYTEVQSMDHLMRNGNITSKEDIEKLGDRSLPAAKATVGGNVIPVHKGPNYVSMAGFDYVASTEEGIVEHVQNNPQEFRQHGIKKMMKGYKFIDMTWEPGAARSTITAVWTGDDFDAEKMDNTAFIQQEPDPSVPACIGCTRDFRMQSLEKDEPVRANSWSTDVPVTQTYDFYVKAMAQRGWKESAAQRFLDKAKPFSPSLSAIQGRMLNLEKDGKTMAISIVPNGEGGSDIMSQERYSGAQSILDAAK